MRRGPRRRRARTLRRQRPLRSRRLYNRVSGGLVLPRPATVWRRRRTISRCRGSASRRVCSPRVSTWSLPLPKRFSGASVLATAIVFMFFLTVGYSGIQLWHITSWKPPTGPTIGEPLPATTVAVLNTEEVVSLQDLLGAEEACALLVLIATDCPFCLRMRETWTRNAAIWSDSVGSYVSKIWLAGDDLSSLNEFYAGYDFDGVTVARLDDNPARALGRLGVFGTPTTYLVDRDGLLRMGVMGERLPPAGVGRDVCAG